MNKKNKALLFFTLVIAAFVISFILDIVKPVVAVNLVSFRYAFNAVCPTISGLTLRGVKGTYSDGGNYLGADCTRTGTPKCICFYSEI